MTERPIPKTAKDLFAPAEPVTNTRDRLTVTALNLFYEYGFHAVGLDRVLREVGVTKTTFYNHFESKDDLIVAAIEMRDRWETRSFEQTVEHFSDGTPRRTVLAFFDALDLWFNDESYKGCLFIKACNEFPSPHDPVHIAAEVVIDKTYAALNDLCQKMKTDEPEELARQLELLIEGALMVRLVKSDDTAAKAARAVAEALLDTHCGTA